MAKNQFLKNISLNLEPGKIVGLLGPNGSGKTTLFNLIIGKIFPDQGSIIFNNEIINNLPIHYKKSKRNKSFGTTQRSFWKYDRMRIIFMQYLELHIKDKEKINEKIDSLLAYFDLRLLKKY